MPDTKALFIHGLIGHMRADALEEKFGERAIVPDLLGYGTRREYEGTIDLQAQVEFLKSVVDERRMTRVHLVGHSIGGAIAVLFARQYPERVVSIINAEGNFTLKDAFWSAPIADSSLNDVELRLAYDRAHPEEWLQRSGVDSTAERVHAARSHLDNQPASTILAMAKSLVDVTSQPHYLDDVMTVLNNGTPMHLLAGERSACDWDVPAFVRDCANLTLLRGTGHLMTIESPVAFADTVSQLIAGYGP